MSQEKVVSAPSTVTAGKKVPRAIASVKATSVAARAAASTVETNVMTTFHSAAALRARAAPTFLRTTDLMSSNERAEFNLTISAMAASAKVAFSASVIFDKSTRPMAMFTMASNLGSSGAPVEYKPASVDAGLSVVLTNVVFAGADAPVDGQLHAPPPAGIA